MKQHITFDQLNELDDKGKEKLRFSFQYPLDDCFIVSTSEGFEEGVALGELCNRGSIDMSKRLYDDKYPIYLLPSIGQMIEFLWKHGYKPSDYELLTFDDTTESLCDDLWEEVKKELKKL